MPAPKHHPNLTRAGEGRPPKPDRVKITTTVSATTKAQLRDMGKIGESIDRILLERDTQAQRIHQLERQIEGLEDRLRGLAPTDLP